MAIQSAVNIYQKVLLESQMENATPHRTVQLLLENALDKLTMVKGFIQRNNIHDKGVTISSVITIIETLQMVLDFEKGEDIANNLNALYTHIISILIEANLKNDVSKIEQSIKILSVIKEGWDSIESMQHASE